MKEVTCFYTVVVEAKGRMYPCKHRHLTREEADACAKTEKGLAIIEWVKDRNPQFVHVWIREDLKPS